MVLFELFKEAREAVKTKGGTIRSNFQTQSLSEYKREVHGYLRLIIMNIIAFYYVSYPEIR